MNKQRDVSVGFNKLWFSLLFSDLADSTFVQFDSKLPAIGNLLYRQPLVASLKTSLKLNN